MTFRIMTDSTVDLDERWLSENDIAVLGLSIELTGEHYHTVGEGKLTSAVLLERMKQGQQPKTSQVNVGQFEKEFESCVRQGLGVLYIGLSSVLSGTYQSATIAKDLVLEKYPDGQIYLIDSLSASGGEALLVMQALSFKNKGVALEEVAKIVMQKALGLDTYFLVDDLNHLMRGGRISKTSAMLGGVVNVKPILTIKEDGELSPLMKVRGRKKAIKELLKHIMAYGKYEQIILAYNGKKDIVLEIKNDLQNDYSEERIEVLDLGPVISAHVGPDTLAIFTLKNS